MCSHACRRSSCVNVVTTSPRRGDPVDGEGGRALMLLRPSRRDPRRTILTGGAKDGSGARLCALRGLLRVDHLPGQEVRDTRSRPNAIFTCVHFIVRRGCNKVTAAERAFSLRPASSMHHLHLNRHHVAINVHFVFCKDFVGKSCGSCAVSSVSDSE